MTTQCFAFDLVTDTAKTGSMYDADIILVIGAILSLKKNHFEIYLIFVCDVEKMDSVFEIVSISE